MPGEIREIRRSGRWRATRCFRDERQHAELWDFGYIGERGLDVDGLLAQLIETLGTDRVDFVDLDRASGLLRYRAVASDGSVFTYDNVTVTVSR